MILFIDLGTDILPAVALAYEDSEDFIMEKPPRKRDDHLVGNYLILGPKLMANAYATIGIFETIAAYFAFFYLFFDFGFTFS